MQRVQLKSRGLKFGEDDLLKKFGGIREDGYSSVIRWVGMTFVRALRYRSDISKLEGTRNMASGGYFIEEVSE